MAIQRPTVWSVLALGAAAAALSLPVPDARAALVSYWSFDDLADADHNGVPDNTLVPDSAGTTAPNDGAMTNMNFADAGTNWTTGQVGNALELDGSNDFIRVTNSPSLTNFTYGLTISMWLKTGTNTNVPLSRWGTNNGYGLYQGSDWYMGNQSAFTHINGDRQADNAWHHYALVWDGKRMISYRDGALVATSPLAGANFASPGGNRLTLGADNRSAPGGAYDGSIDEVAIWDAALPQASIQRLANGTDTPPTAWAPTGLITFADMAASFDPIPAGYSFGLPLWLSTNWNGRWYAWDGNGGAHSDHTPDGINRSGYLGDHTGSIDFSTAVYVPSLWIYHTGWGDTGDWTITGLLDGVPMWSYTHATADQTWTEVTAGANIPIDRLYFTGAQYNVMDDIMVTGVPEPQAALLLILGAAGLLPAFRRARRRSTSA